MHGVLEVNPPSAGRECCPEPYATSCAMRPCGKRAQADLGTRSSHPQPLLLWRHDRQQLLRRACTDVGQDRQQHRGAGDPALRRHSHDGRLDARKSEWEQKIRQGGREGDIYRYLRSLRDHYADLIRKNYPPIPRRVSGYNLDQLIPGEDGRFNVARSLVGSEGTLVTILEAKCKLIDASAERVLLMLGYPDVYEAADHVMDIDRVPAHGTGGHRSRAYPTTSKKKGGPHRKYLELLPEGKGWLMVEFGADKKQDALDPAHHVMDMLKSKPGAPT